MEIEENIYHAFKGNRLRVCLLLVPFKCSLSISNEPLECISKNENLHVNYSLDQR
jgi:hypothetical protein